MANISGFSNTVNVQPDPVPDVVVGPWNINPLTVTPLPGAISVEFTANTAFEDLGIKAVVIQCATVANFANILQTKRLLPDVDYGNADPEGATFFPNLQPGTTYYFRAYLEF